MMERLSYVALHSGGAVNKGTCKPTFIPLLVVAPIVSNSQNIWPTPITLIDEKLKFWSQYNFDVDSDDHLLPLEKAIKAPSNTMFAMQRNFVVL